MPKTKHHGYTLLLADFQYHANTQQHLEPDEERLSNLRMYLTAHSVSEILHAIYGVENLVVKFNIQDYSLENPMAFVSKIALQEFISDIRQLKNHNDGIFFAHIDRHEIPNMRINSTKCAPTLIALA